MTMGRPSSTALSYFQNHNDDIVFYAEGSTAVLTSLLADTGRNRIVYMSSIATLASRRNRKTTVVFSRHSRLVYNVMTLFRPPLPRLLAKITFGTRDNTHVYNRTHN